MQDDLDVIKDIRTGSLIINKVFARVTSTAEPSHMVQKELCYMFTSKFRNQMVRYFSPEDLLQLMCVDRKMYFVIRTNRTLISHIVGCRVRGVSGALKNAQEDSTYFQRIGESIPEEVLQQGMAKFMAFRFQAGSYFNDVLKESFEFLEGKDM